MHVRQTVSIRRSSALLSNIGELSWLEDAKKKKVYFFSLSPFFQVIVYSFNLFGVERFLRSVFIYQTCFLKICSAFDCL